MYFWHESGIACHHRAHHRGQSAALAGRAALLFRVKIAAWRLRRHPGRALAGGSRT